MPETESLSMVNDKPGAPSPVEGYGASSTADSLAGRVTADFQKASSARLYQEQQIFVRALFNTRAHYLDLQNQTTTSRAFVSATRPKIQTAVALLMPIICPPGSDSFTLEPDPCSVDPVEAIQLLSRGVPVNEIQNQLSLDAGKKVDRLTKKIHKGLSSTAFADKVLQYLFNMGVFGTGIMQGPLPVPNPECVAPDAPTPDLDAWDQIKSWFNPNKPVDQQAQFQKLIDAGILDEYAPLVNVISPLDFYPDPSAYTLDQCRYVIWRMVMGKAQVMEMLNDDSFKHDVVERIIQDHPEGIWQPTYWETAINALNKQPQQSVPNGRFICYQWWGFMTGKDLHDAGVTDIPKERFKERVVAQIWCIGGEVVKVAISELHNNRLPFYITPYSYAPNSIWGIGPAEMMFDAQDAINATERSIMDNMAVSNAPQVIVDVEQLHDPSSVLEIRPRKIWAVKGAVGVQHKPIEFFNVPDNLQSLLAVQANEERLAQEQTGLPNFLQGAGGEGVHNRTLGGANLQFNNAITSLKTACYNIENTLIVPLINKMIRFIQMYSKDPQIKGAFQVSAHGIKGLLARESLAAAINELVKNLGNIPGGIDRLKMNNLFHAYFRTTGLVHEDLVYNDEEFAKVQQQQQEQKAYDAGLQASVAAQPKMRAEMTPKDAVMELAKDAPENSDLKLVYMKRASQMYNLLDPELEEAFDKAMMLNHFGQVNQAHELGANVRSRSMEAMAAEQAGNQPAQAPASVAPMGGGNAGSF